MTLFSPHINFIIVYHRVTDIGIHTSKKKNWHTSKIIWGARPIWSPTKNIGGLAPPGLTLMTSGVPRNFSWGHISVQKNWCPFLVISHVFHFQFSFSCCKIRTNFYIFSCLRGHMPRHIQKFSQIYTKSCKKIFLIRLGGPGTPQDPLATPMAQHTLTSPI